MGKGQRGRLYPGGEPVFVRVKHVPGGDWSVLLVRLVGDLQLGLESLVFLEIVDLRQDMAGVPRPGREEKGKGQGGRVVREQNRADGFLLNETFLKI